jgi:hypothetical protein
MPLPEPYQGVRPLAPDIRLQTVVRTCSATALCLVVNVDACSNSRSSTLRKESGKRTCIMTMSRITSGEELKRRNQQAA